MSLLWKTHEYMHREKNSDWYWIVGIVSVTLCVISILLGNLMFGVFILVATFTLVLYASRPPQELEVELGDKGIRIDDTFYPYRSIDSFWIEEFELHPRILIKTHRKIFPYISVLLYDVEPEEVKTYLSQYIPEEFHSESFIEKLFIYFGF